jgi:hypothetical protein
MSVTACLVAKTVLLVIHLAPHQENGFYSQDSLHALRANELIRITLAAMQDPVAAHPALRNFTLYSVALQNPVTVHHALIISSCPARPCDNSWCSVRPEVVLKEIDKIMHK